MNKIKIIYSLVVSLLLLFNSSCTEECDHLVLDGDDAYITSCNVKLGTISFEASTIGDTITVSVPDYIDLSRISVTLDISENAEIAPLPESITDWSEPVDFSIVSASGLTTKDYVVCIVPVVESNAYEGSIRIGSQKELNNFFENGYTKVESIILYGGNTIDPIRDLSAMKTLREVPGDLFIKGISARHIVLENLESVGNFFINSASTTKVRLPKLKFVAQRFRIGEDDPGPIPVPHFDLEEVYLPSLEYVGGQFTLFGCLKLETLESLSNLTYVGKDLTINGGVFENLKGLENIETVNGNLTIDGQLSSFEGLNINTVTGMVSLFCDNITDLSPVSGIKNIGKGLLLKGNKYLKNLKGLEGVNTSIIHIETFLSLESLEGLPVKSNMDFLTLKAMPELTDISALSTLERVEHSFSLVGIDKLTSLEGLNNLKYVGGTFALSNVAGLEDISALSNLTTVGGEVLFSFMLSLKNFSGLEKLTSAGSLYFYNLIGLESLTGLNNLEKLTNGGLTILFCPLITNLDGLSGLKELNLYYYDDMIQIVYNEKLTSYAGIGALLQEYYPQQKVEIAQNAYNPTAVDIAAGRFVKL